MKAGLLLGQKYSQINQKSFIKYLCHYCSVADVEKGVDRLFKVQKLIRVGWQSTEFYFDEWDRFLHD